MVLISIKLDYRRLSRR